MLHYLTGTSSEHRRRRLHKNSFNAERCLSVTASRPRNSVGTITREWMCEGKVRRVLYERTAFRPIRRFFGGRTLTYYGRWTYKFEEATRRGAVAAHHHSYNAHVPATDGGWCGAPAAASIRKRNSTRPARAQVRRMGNAKRGRQTGRIQPAKRARTAGDGQPKNFPAYSDWAELPGEFP